MNFNIMMSPRSRGAGVDPKTSVKLFSLLLLAAVASLLLSPISGPQAEQAGPMSISVTTPEGLITVSKVVEPEWISPRGYGIPDMATVTITVKGATLGAGQWRLPLDVVVVVDRSATIRLAETREAVSQLLELLAPGDRVALVSFADAARQELDFTEVTPELKGELLRIIEEFINQGKTACDSGVALATQLLHRGGRPRALWAEVIFTDGMCTHGREPDRQLLEAVSRGIAPLIVGVSSVSWAFASRVRELEGVQFFPSSAFFMDFLARKLAGIEGIAGEKLVLIEQLSRYVNYEGEASEPPTVRAAAQDRSMLLQWQRERLGLGEVWRISFKISARKSGELPVEQLGELRFVNPLSGAPMPPLRLPTVTIRVKNAPPICSFTYEPLKPTVEDDINFYDKSYDPFGDMIVSWMWDFGDGTTSSIRNPTHRYRHPGSYWVSLQICDDQGACEGCGRTVTVLPVWVTAERSVLTFPFRRILSGRSYTAKVVIEPQEEVCIRGMGLRELYPEGWEITPLESNGAQFKPPNEWIWQGPLGPGCREPAAPTPTPAPAPSPEPWVSYEVAVPADLPPGVYPISGQVSSFAPRFEVRVGGVTSLEVVEALPIEVAIACLDVEANEPDPTYCYDERGRAVISQAQIERAKELYHAGEPVPGTGGQVIDYEMMLKLLAYYETGTPVTQPLPSG